MSNGKYCTFYGNYSPSSKSLNCLIKIESNIKNAIINVELDSVSVKTKEGLQKFCFKSLRLSPETCRGLKYLSDTELQFMLEAIDVTKDTETVEIFSPGASQSETVDRIKLEQNKWFCATCSQKVLSDRCIFSRVLPLPSENWMDYADMWFCHNHGGEDEESQRKQNLLPKSKECFVGETFVLVNKQHLMKGFTKIREDHAVVCQRCGRQLGNLTEPDGDIVKLFLHMVDIGDQEEEENKSHNKRIQKSEEFFSHLLLEQRQLYTSYRFIIEAKLNPSSKSSSASSPSSSLSSGETSTCLVWLLDSSGSIYQSDSHGEPGHLQNNQVVSVLFKCLLEPSTSDSDPITKSLVSLWRRDNAVHGVTLAHPVLLQLVATLVQNCKTLPKSQRYVNGFHVSFLRRTQPAS